MSNREAKNKNTLIDNCAKLAKKLAAGDVHACDDFCQAINCPSPKLVWSPEVGSLPLDNMNWAYDWWLKNKGDELAPPPDCIIPENLVRILGNLILLETCEGGTNFLTRLYGSKIQKHPGRDMTGQLVSETWTPLRGYFLINYQAVYQRKEVLFSCHTPPQDVNVTAWNRLILPFVEDGLVRKILVSIYPTQRQKDEALF